jgi:hypothetical protein
VSSVIDKLYEDYSSPVFALIAVRGARYGKSGLHRLSEIRFSDGRRKRDPGAVVEQSRSR